MFTARMLAERWHCSERAVRALIARGGLKTVRLGRLVRIPEDALLEVERVGVARLVALRPRYAPEHAGDGEGGRAMSAVE
jgi:excisionase family DNA binding protein